MISQDDIDAMAEPQNRDFYMTDPVCKRLQWEVRSAFERGYRAAGMSNGQSAINPNKGKWFDHWMNSKSRAFLVANGLMTGDEGYK
jgi:hypothetical protein